MVVESVSRGDARMSGPLHSEAAFETVIEAHLLATRYISITGVEIECERAVFPETVLPFFP